jgi:hypothetical protein
MKTKQLKLGFERKKEGDEMHPFTIWVKIELSVAKDNPSIITDGWYK